MACKFPPGSTIPDFQLETTNGNFNLYQFQNKRWLVIYTVPKAFEAVSTMEMSQINEHLDKLGRRNVSFIALNGNTIEGE